MAKTKQPKSHAAWGSLPAYNVTDTALFLHTGPDNIRSLMNLELIKGIKLQSMVIPQFEIQRFMKDNLGKDLSEIIASEKERRRLEKEGHKLIEVR